MSKDSTRYLVGNAKNGHIPSIFTLSGIGDENNQYKYFNEIIEVLDNTTDYRVYLNDKIYLIIEKLMIYIWIFTIN